MKKIVLSLAVLATLANSEMLRSEAMEIVFDTDTKLLWQDDIGAKQRGTKMKNFSLKHEE